MLPTVPTIARRAPRRPPHRPPRRRRLGPLAALAAVLAACAGEPAPPADPAPGTAAAQTSPADRLPAGPAGDTVRRALEAHGGWETWAGKRSVEYTKTTTRFDEQGQVTRRVVQRHLYRLQPELGVRIESRDEEGRQVVLLNDGDEAWKLVDGELARSQEDRDQAWNSTFGSHYVFAMPFKLLDPGTLLADAGETTLPDGRRVRGVRADYAPGAGSAGGLHTWTYWFGAEDGLLAANHLTYGPGAEDHDATDYLEYRAVDGIQLPGRRVGHAADADQNRGRKLSEITYEEVRFDVPVTDDAFRPPPGAAAAPESAPPP